MATSNEPADQKSLTSDMDKGISVTDQQESSIENDMESEDHDDLTLPPVDGRQAWTVAVGLCITALFSGVVICW